MHISAHNYKYIYYWHNMSKFLIRASNVKFSVRCQTNPRGEPARGTYCTRHMVPHTVFNIISLHALMIPWQRTLLNHYYKRRYNTWEYGSVQMPNSTEAHHVPTVEFAPQPQQTKNNIYWINHIVCLHLWVWVFPQNNVLRMY